MSQNHSPELISQQAKETIALYRAKIAKSGDLPGLVDNKTFLEANLEDDDSADSALIQDILKDASLTKKVLSVANSPMYRMYESTTTISRAVSLLGRDTISQLAFSQTVLGDFSDLKNESADARSILETASVAGSLAREVSTMCMKDGMSGTSFPEGDTSRISPQDGEMAAIYALLQPFGQLVISYYTPDVWKQIQLQASDANQSTDETCLDILGLTPASLGQELMKSWGIPSQIVDAVGTEEPDVDVSKPLDRNQWLRSLASMSNKIVKAISVNDTAGAERIAKTYSKAIGVQNVSDIIQSSNRIFSDAKEKGFSFFATEENQGTFKDRLSAYISDISQMSLSGRKHIKYIVSHYAEILTKELGVSKNIIFLLSENTYKGTSAMNLPFPPGDVTFSADFAPDLIRSVLRSNANYLLRRDSDNVQKVKSQMPAWWTSKMGTVPNQFMISPLIIQKQSLKPLCFIFLEWSDDSSPDIDLKLVSNLWKAVNEALQKAASIP